MGFFKRLLSFIFGMIFMLVLEVGALVGGGFYLYKNLTLESTGLTENGKFANGVDLGELSGYTIEKWIKFIAEASDDPEGFTLGSLKEQGFDIVDTFTKLGVDFTNSDDRDVQALKDVAPLLLFSNKGLNELNMSILFAFLPKNEDGKYSVFSNSLREKLRNESIGSITSKNDTTNALNIFNLLKGSKVGALLPQTFTETLEGGEYTYTCESPSLELVGNLPFDFISYYAENKEPIDFGKHLQPAGTLEEYGEMSTGEFLAKLTCKTHDDYDFSYEKFSNIIDLPLKDVFYQKDPSAIYTLNVDLILDTIKIGSVLNMCHCTENDSCKIHSSISDCDGKWYQIIELNCSSNDECQIHNNVSDCDGKSKISYAVQDDGGLNGLIMNNLYDCSIKNVQENLNLTSLTKNVYLGYAFGNTIGYQEGSGYCEEDCSNTSEGHNHKYLWIDSDGKPVTTIMNQLSNISLQDAMKEGGLSLETMFEGLTLGDLMGYYKVEGAWCEKVQCTNNADCTIHNGVGCDGLVHYITLSSDSLANEISLNIYDELLTDLLEGGFDFASVVDGIYLGKSLGYTIGDGGTCPKNCNVDHTHSYQWYNGTEKVNTLNNNIANISLVKVITTGFDIDGIISGVAIGEMLGYKKSGDEWLNGDGTSINKNTAIDKIMYNLYDETIETLKGGLDISKLVNEITLGELVNCQYNTTENWWEKEGVKVPYLENVLYSTELSQLVSGNVQIIEDIVGHHKIGDICGAEYDETSKVWYETNEFGSKVEVSKISGILYNLKLNQVLIGEFDISENFGDLYISDIIEMHPTSQPFLHAIANIKINSIETEINNIYLGEMLGYEEVEEGVWKQKVIEKCPAANGCGDEICSISSEDGLYYHTYYLELASKFNQVLANKTVGELCETGLGEITLGDIFEESDYNSGVFKLIDYTGYASIDKVPINIVPEKVTSGLKNNATCNDMIELGVIDTQTAEKVDAILGNDWKSLKMGSFIDALVNKIIQLQTENEQLKNN